MIKYWKWDHLSGARQTYSIIHDGILYTVEKTLFGWTAMRGDTPVKLGEHIRTFETPGEAKVFLTIEEHFRNLINLEGYTRVSFEYRGSKFELRESRFGYYAMQNDLFMTDENGACVTLPSIADLFLWIENNL